MEDFLPPPPPKNEIQGELLPPPPKKKVETPGIPYALPLNSDGDVGTSESTPGDSGLLGMITAKNKAESNAAPQELPSPQSTAKIAPKPAPAKNGIDLTVPQMASESTSILGIAPKIFETKLKTQKDYAAGEMTSKELEAQVKRLDAATAQTTQDAAFSPEEQRANKEALDNIAKTNTPDKPRETLDDVSAKIKDVEERLSKATNLDKAPLFAELNGLNDKREALALNPENALRGFIPEAIKGYEKDIVDHYSRLNKNNPGAFKSAIDKILQGEFTEDEQVRVLSGIMKDKFAATSRDIDILDRRGVTDLYKNLHSKTEEVSGMIDQANALVSEYNTTGSKDALVKQQELAKKIAAEQEQIKKDYSDPEITKQLSELHDVSSAQSKLYGDSKEMTMKFPSLVLKEAKQRYENEYLKENPKLGTAKEIGARVYNGFLDAGVSLIETGKNLAGAIDGKDTDTYTSGDVMLGKTKDFLDSYVRLSTSEKPFIYKDKKGETQQDWSRFLPELATMGTNMYTLIAGGGSIGKGLSSAGMAAANAQKSGLFLSSMINTYGNYYKDAISQELSPTQAHEMAMGQAAATSLLELISPNAGMFGKNLSKQSVQEAVEMLTKKGSSITFDKIMKALAIEPSKELVQEFSQGFADKVAGVIGNNVFNPNEKFETTMGSVEAQSTAILTYATTAILGVGTMPSNSKIKNAARFELGKDLSETTKYLEEAEKNGEITAQQRSSVTKQANDAALIINKMPEDLSDGKKNLILPLLDEKQQLEEKNKSIDKVFQTKNKERIAAIDEEINGIVAKKDNVSQEAPAEMAAAENATAPADNTTPSATPATEAAPAATPELATPTTYTDKNGVQRTYGEDIEADKAHAIYKTMSELGEAGREAGHTEAVKRFKKDGTVSYTKKESIEAALKDEKLNVEMQADGTAKVIGIKDGDTWIGKAPSEAENNSATAESMRALPALDGAESLAQESYDILDTIDFNDKKSIDSGVSKILEIINNKFIPENKVEQVLTDKSKLIGNKDFFTKDYLDKYISYTTKNFEAASPASDTLTDEEENTLSPEEQERYQMAILTNDTGTVNSVVESVRKPSVVPAITPTAEPIVAPTAAEAAPAATVATAAPVVAEEVAPTPNTNTTPAENTTKPELTKKEIEEKIGDLRLGRKVSVKEAAAIREMIRKQFADKPAIKNALMDKIDEAEEFRTAKLADIAQRKAKITKEIEAQSRKAGEPGLGVFGTLQNVGPLLKLATLYSERGYLSFREALIKADFFGKNNMNLEDVEAELKKLFDDVNGIKEEVVSPAEETTPAEKPAGKKEASKPAEKKESKRPEKTDNERAAITKILENPDFSEEIKDYIRDHGDLRNYVPISFHVTAEEANAIIEAKGVEGATKMVLDKENGMKGYARTALGFALMDKYNQLAAEARAGGDMDLAIEYAERNLDIVKMDSIDSTDIAQQLSARQLLNKLSPESYAIETQRRINKANKEKMPDAEAKATEVIEKVKEVDANANEHISDAVADVLSEKENETKVKELEAKIKELEEKLKKKRQAQKTAGETSQAKNKSKNKIFTEEGLKEALKVFRQFNDVTNPEIYKSSAYVAGYVLEKGARNFAEFSAAMASHIGKKFEHLFPRLYSEARNKLVENGIPKKEFESDQEVDNQVKEILRNKEERELEALKKELENEKSRKPKSAKIINQALRDAGFKHSNGAIDWKAIVGNANNIDTAKENIEKALSENTQLSKEQIKERIDAVTKRFDEIVHDKKSKILYKQFENEIIKGFRDQARDLDNAQRDVANQEKDKQKAIERAEKDAKKAYEKQVKAAENIKDKAEKEAKIAAAKAKKDAYIKKRRNEIEKVHEDFLIKQFKKEAGIRNVVKNKIDKAVNLSNMGALTKTKMLDVFGKELGLHTFTAEDAIALTDLVHAVQIAPPGNLQNNAVEALTYFMRSRFPGHQMRIFRDKMYSRLLSGEFTFLKNSIAYFGNITETLTRFAKTNFDLEYMRRGFYLDMNAVKIFGKTHVNQGNLLSVLFKGETIKGNSYMNEQVGDGLPQARNLEYHKAQLRNAGKNPLLLAANGRAHVLNAEKYVGRGLDSVDYANQNRTSELKQYSYVKKQIAQENPTMSNKDIARRAWEEMYQGSFIRAKVQARKDYAKVGNDNPKNYQLNRRAHEILREGRRPDAVEEGRLQGLSMAYKGRPDGIMAIPVALVNAFKQGLDGVINQSKHTGMSQMNIERVRFTKDIIMMQIVPFVNGVGNFIEKGLELVPPYGLAKAAVYGGVSVFRKDPTIKQREESKAGDMAMRAVAGTMYIGIMMALMALSRAMDDDKDDILDTGLFGHGDKNYGRAKVSGAVNPKNTLRIFGHNISLDYLGAFGVALKVFANYLDNQKYGKEVKLFDPERPFEAEADFTWMTIGSILDSSPMAGANQIVGYLADPSSDRSEKYFKRMLAHQMTQSIVPFKATINQTYSAINHNSKEAITLLENMEKSTGFIAGWMLDRPTLDWLGRPVDSGDAYTNSAAGATHMFKKAKATDVDVFLDKIGIHAPTMKRKDEDIFVHENNEDKARYLTATEYYDYKVLVANRLRESVFGNFGQSRAFYNQTANSFGADEAKKNYQSEINAWNREAEEEALKEIQQKIEAEE